MTAAIPNESILASCAEARFQRGAMNAAGSKVTSLRRQSAGVERIQQARARGMSDEIAIDALEDQVALWDYRSRTEPDQVSADHSRVMGDIAAIALDALRARRDEPHDDGPRLAR